jgi:hypothetical protein
MLLSSFLALDLLLNQRIEGMRSEAIFAYNLSLVKNLLQSFMNVFDLWIIHSALGTFVLFNRLVLETPQAKVFLAVGTGTWMLHQSLANLTLKWVFNVLWL